MKKVNRENVRRITFKVPWDLSGEWSGWIFPDAHLVSAEDATDDDWELLEEYQHGWYLVTELEGAHWGESFYVDRDDIHYACRRHDGLGSGWGYHEPVAGNGLNDCGGDGPAYYVPDASEDDDDWVYEEGGAYTLYLT